METIGGNDLQYLQVSLPLALLGCFLFLQGWRWPMPQPSKFTFNLSNLSSVSADDTPVMTPLWWRLMTPLWWRHSDDAPLMTPLWWRLMTPLWWRLMMPLYDAWWCPCDDASLMTPLYAPDDAPLMTPLWWRRSDDAPLMTPLWWRPSDDAPLMTTLWWRLMISLWWRLSDDTFLMTPDDDWRLSPPSAVYEPAGEGVPRAGPAAGVRRDEGQHPALLGRRRPRGRSGHGTNGLRRREADRRWDAGAMVYCNGSTVSLDSSDTRRAAAWRTKPS